MERTIRTVDDVLLLLDGLVAPGADRWTEGGAGWWDGFYTDRSRPIPFFVAKPDENLVTYIDRGLIRPGRVLDLGCGPGRNALYLASLGFDVTAVDLSPVAIAWAEERARQSGATIRFRCADAFVTAETDPVASYDLIYDSGCFHHLPPHRRISYLTLVDRVLAPGGHLALACFDRGDSGACELSDEDIYRLGIVPGGVAYTPDSLRWIFSDLTEVELRRMNDEPSESALFGKPFVWTALFRRDAQPSKR